MRAMSSPLSKPQFAGNGFELPVSYAKLTQVPYSVLHVVVTGAKLAFALLYQVENVIVRKLSRILGVGAIDDECQGRDWVRLVRQMDRFQNLDVNIRELFPLAEVNQRFIPKRRLHFKGETATRAAAIQPKDEPWLGWCTTILMRVDAEAAVETMERARNALHKPEARPPHQ